MRRARQFAAAVTASLPIAGAFFLLLFSGADSHAQGPSAVCKDAAEVAVLPSPVAPWKGAPLRVLFVAEKPLEGELSLVAPDGSVAAASRERHGGPPYFWFAEVASPAAGTWRAKLARERAPAECSTITREIVVRAAEPPRPHAVAGSVWPVRNAWDRAHENLYSAWIEKLFDDPLDAAPSWPALHVVLRDRSRNFLFNHLGLREDQLGHVVRPDCADLPYFLRAYFAFKMGLPFGYAKCTRGGGGGAPRCPAWWNIQNEEPPPTPPPEEDRRIRPPDRVRQPIQHVSPARSAAGGKAARTSGARISAAAGSCGDRTWGAREATRASAAAAGTHGSVQPLLAAQRRQLGPFRRRANAVERRQHGSLSGVAGPGDAAPGDRVRRSVRTPFGAGAARVAVARRGRA